MKIRVKKAEYEQAVYIHWASNLLDKHGDNWRDEGNKIIQQRKVMIIEQQEIPKNEELERAVIEMDNSHNILIVSGCVIYFGWFCLQVYFVSIILSIK